MEPVFKLLCKGVLMDSYTRSNIIDTNQYAIVIEMGDRKILFRAATGEQGMEGPFTFVELQEEGEDSGGFCITREFEFNALWKFLEAGCR